LAPHWHQWDDEDLLLKVYIQPRASTDSLDGTHGDRLKIRLTAPPVDGKANSHLIRFLAECFGVPRSQVQLISGKSSRAKRVRIQRPRQTPAGIPLRSADMNHPVNDQDSTHQGSSVIVMNQSRYR
jgi:uncharacterized protein (TIGR00251 family)